MEAEVATIGQLLGDALTFGIKLRHIEPLTASDSPAGAVIETQQATDGRVLDGIRYTSDAIGLARIEHIVCYNLLAARLRVHVDAGVKIAHVLECTLKVQTRKSSLNSVIEHWSLADGMQRAVDPSAGIASSQRVSVQRQFESREPAGVATLTNVVLQLSNVDVFVSLFRDLHFDTIEQVLSFRDELRLGA